MTVDTLLQMRVKSKKEEVMGTMEIMSLIYENAAGNPQGDNYSEGRGCISSGKRRNEGKKQVLRNR